MSKGQLGRAIGRLCGLVGMRPDSDSTDRELLERFTDRGDEGAFEALLARHGPAVLGVCRRVLGEGQDADDAFQATFLILVLKARSIRKKNSLSSWLYAVARRVAARARADSARRRALHDRVARQRSEASAEATWDDLRPVLDEELARLPHKYRAPLVLCYLEGKTNEQAARELGWSSGSMSRRLARARELLRGRLVRRGLALSAGGLAALLPQAAPAAVPAGLASAAAGVSLHAMTGQVAAGAAPAVLGLAKGVMHAMFLTKLKLVSSVLLSLCLLGTGAGLLWQREPVEAAAAPVPQTAAAQRPAPQQVEGKPQAAQPPGGKLTIIRQAKDKAPVKQEERVFAIAFAPDGRRVAVGFADRVVLHETAQWRVLATFKAENRGAVGLAFSPDGKLIGTASGGGDRVVRLWDAATGRLLRTFQGHQGGVTAVHFSPDGKYLASAGQDKTVRLWDLATGLEDTRIEGLDRDAAAVGFAPDGRTLATGGAKDGAAYLWDLTAGKLRTKLQGDKGAVEALAFAPDARTVATAGADGQVRLWDVETGKELRRLQGHKGAVRGVVFSPDGKHLATAGADGKVRLWDVSSGQVRDLPGNHPGAGAVRFSPDGQLLVFGSGRGIRVWDLGQNQEIGPRE